MEVRQVSEIVEDLYYKMLRKDTFDMYKIVKQLQEDTSMTFDNTVKIVELTLINRSAERGSFF